MNLPKFLRGPFTQSVKVGAAALVERMITNRNFRPVRRVVITYTPVSVVRTYLFPWMGTQEVTTLWNMVIETKLNDGRTFTYMHVSQTSLELALDAAYMVGIQKALKVLQNEQLPALKANA